MTILTSRKKSEASETAAAEILERIDGVLEGDDFPALPTLPHSSSLDLGQVVPSVASVSSVCCGVGFARRDRIKRKSAWF